MQSRQIRNLMFLLVLLSCPVICSCQRTAESGVKGMDFTPREWADADPDERGLMIMDLCEKYCSLRGLSEEKVLDLLGTPEKKTPSNYYYSIGKRPSCPSAIDPVPHMLHIRFVHGTVMSVYPIQSSDVPAE